VQANERYNKGILIIIVHRCEGYTVLSIKEGGDNLMEKQGTRPTIFPRVENYTLVKTLLLPALG